MKVSRFSYTELLVSWLFVYFSSKLLWDCIPFVFELFSLALIALCAVFQLFGKPGMTQHKANLFITFLLFSVYIIANGLFQNNFTQLVRAIYEYIFYVLIFFAMTWLLPRVDLRKCLKVFAFWGVFVAILSWFEFITQHHLLIDLGVDINAGFRSAVFSRSYLNHGMFLGFFALTCLDICYAEKKPLWLIPGAFCFVSILTTGSRGPLVACGIALGVQFMLYAYNSCRHSYKRFAACSLLCIAFLAVLVVMFGTFETSSETINNFLRRVRSILDWSGDPGNIGRLHLWRNALDLFKSNIWFGIGPSKTGAWNDASIVVTESGVLKRLCELGLIGFILHYYFVACILIKGVRTYRKQDPATKHPMTFWFSLVIAILINDCTLQATEEIMISFYMWTAFAGLECTSPATNLPD